MPRLVRIPNLPPEAVPEGEPLRLKDGQVSQQYRIETPPAEPCPRIFEVVGERVFELMFDD